MGNARTPKDSPGRKAQASAQGGMHGHSRRPDRQAGAGVVRRDAPIKSYSGLPPNVLHKTPALREISACKEPRKEQNGEGISARSFDDGEHQLTRHRHAGETQLGPVRPLACKGSPALGR